MPATVEDLHGGHMSTTISGRRKAPQNMEEIVFKK